MPGIPTGRGWVDPQHHISRGRPVDRTSDVTDHVTVVLRMTLVVFIAGRLLDVDLRLVSSGGRCFEASLPHRRKRVRSLIPYHSPGPVRCGYC